MEFLRSLPSWRNGGWMRYCWALGVGIAVLGLLGIVLKDYLDLMLPAGILVAFFPALYMLFFILIWVLFYALTFPLRLWCHLRLWAINRLGKVRADEGQKFATILKRMDKVGEWAFSRW